MGRPDSCSHTFQTLSCSPWFRCCRLHKHSAVWYCRYPQLATSAQINSMLAGTLWLHCPGSAVFCRRCLPAKPSSTNPSLSERAASAGRLVEDWADVCSTMEPQDVRSSCLQHCEPLVRRRGQRLKPAFKVVRIVQGSSSHAVRLRQIMVKALVNFTAAGTHAGSPHCSHLLGRWTMPAAGLAWRI